MPSASAEAKAGINYGDETYPASALATAHLLREDLETTFGGDRWHYFPREKWIAISHNPTWRTLIKPWLELQGVPIPDYLADRGVEPAPAMTAFPFADFPTLAQLRTAEQGGIVVAERVTLGTQASADLVITKFLALGTTARVRLAFVFTSVDLGTQASITTLVTPRHVSPQLGTMAVVKEHRTPDTTQVVSQAIQAARNAGRL